MTVAQRRARLGHRHRLAEPASTAVEVAEAVVALHATDPATVHLSAAARMSTPSIAAMADALYRERSLARILAMRRTMFVTSIPTLGTVDRSSAPEVAATERRKLEGWMADAGLVDPARWLADAASEIIDVLEAADEAGLAARELTAAVPRLSTRSRMGVDRNGPPRPGSRRGSCSSWRPRGS